MEVKEIKPKKATASVLKSKAPVRGSTMKYSKPNAKKKVDSGDPQWKKASTIKSKNANEIIGSNKEERAKIEPKIAEKVEYEVRKDNRTQEPDFIREDFVFHKIKADTNGDDSTEGECNIITIKLKLKGGEQEEIKISETITIKQLKDEICQVSALDTTTQSAFLCNFKLLC